MPKPRDRDVENDLLDMEEDKNTILDSGEGDCDWLDDDQWLHVTAPTTPLKTGFLETVRMTPQSRRPN